MDGWIALIMLAAGISIFLSNCKTVKIDIIYVHTLSCLTSEGFTWWLTLTAANEISKTTLLKKSIDDSFFLYR